MQKECLRFRTRYMRESRSRGNRLQQSFERYYHLPFFGRAASTIFKTSFLVSNVGAFNQKSKKLLFFFHHRIWSSFTVSSMHNSTSKLIHQHCMSDAIVSSFISPFFTDSMTLTMDSSVHNHSGYLMTFSCILAACSLCLLADLFTCQLFLWAILIPKQVHVSSLDPYSSAYFR